MGGDRAGREAIAAARLNHPGIVALYEAGEDPQARYLVSEYIAGDTLADLLSSGALSDRDIAVIGIALTDALAHAHERRVVHRDVKPQNVIIPEAPQSVAGVAKLTDFGIARLVGDDPMTRTGDVVGTLAYMAPEQAEGHETGAPADVYSLALVLYEGLAGHNPVAGGSPAATARRVGRPLPPLGRTRDDLPPSLSAAIDRAVSIDPDQRGSLRDLRTALAGAADDLDDEGGAIARTPALRGLPRGSHRIAGAGAAAGLAAAATTLLSQPPHAGIVAGATALAVLLLPRIGWLAAAAPWGGCVRAARSTRCRAAPGGGDRARAAAPAQAPARLVAPGRRAVARPRGARAGLPALAGRPGKLDARRSAPLGAWWLVLAEPLLGKILFAGSGFAAGPPGSDERRTAPTTRAGPALRTGAISLAAVWALAAVVLPWMVRGRSLATDLLAAAAWAGALGAASGYVADLALAGGQARGIAAGSALAGVLAVILRLARGPDVHRDAGTLERLMSVLRSLESKIAGLVEGAFGRAFRSELRPVEIARKLAREMEEHRTVSISQDLRPQRVRGLPLARGPRALRRLRGRAAQGARGLPARARAPGEARAAVAPADRTSTSTTGSPSASSASRRGSCAPPRTRPPSRAGRRRPHDDLQRRAPAPADEAARPAVGRAARRWSSSTASGWWSGRQGAVLGRSRATATSSWPTPTCRAATPRSARWATAGRSADLGSTNGVRVNGQRVRRACAAPRWRADRAGHGRVALRAGVALEPVSVALKFGFLIVLYLFLLWVARSALKDLRRGAARRRRRR